MNDPFLKKWMEMLNAEPKTAYNANMTIVVISSRVAKMTKRRQKIAIAKGKCKKTECTGVYPQGVRFETSSPLQTNHRPEDPSLVYCAGMASRSGNLEIRHQKSRPPGTSEIEFTCTMSFLDISE